MIRKPSVYADKNEPTAVYDAALSGVCQWKNLELFRFALFFLHFSLILSVRSQTATAAFLNRGHQRCVQGV
jgi:hypothetical protein